MSRRFAQSLQVPKKIIKTEYKIEIPEIPKRFEIKKMESKEMPKLKKEIKPKEIKLKINSKPENKRKVAGELLREILEQDFQFLDLKNIEIHEKNKTIAVFYDGIALDKRIQRAISGRVRYLTNQTFNIQFQRNLQKSNIFEILDAVESELRQKK